jgi:hypothetical protein
MRVCVVFSVSSRFVDWRRLCELKMGLDDGGPMIGKSDNLGCTDRFSHSTEKSE